MTICLPPASRTSSPDREGVLDNIVRHKRGEIAALSLRGRPSARKRAAAKPLSLEAALTKPGPRFIFEYKRSSPSQGVLQANGSPAKMAKTYRRFADAVSVLTDSKFFKGSYHDLAAFRAAVKVPILCKDFILDESQILAAYAAGADAVLLMLSILNDRAYLRLSKYARELGLEVLTEVHGTEELARALILGARLVGINNRDLRTLDVSLETTRRLAPLAPDRVTLVSESGIAQRKDVLDLSSLADGFLVGTAAMQSHRPDLVVRDLTFGQVKICGLTQRTDARAAYNAGASYGGVNFVAGTPRALTPRAAKGVIGNVPLKWVGIFRGAAAPFVAEAARNLNLAAVQLHGRETASYRACLRKTLPKSCEIWQAVEASGAAALIKPRECDRVLLDSRTGSVFGGTGKTFDWRRLERTKGIAGFGLAGGITPDNVAEAASTGAGIIDVCSGVEKAPGIKSPAKLKALFGAIRAAGGRVRGLERC